jgi:hypothetical protein
MQPGRELGAGHARQRQRVYQLGQRGLRQRLQQHAHQRPGGGQRVQQQGRRAAGGRRAQAEHAAGRGTDRARAAAGIGLPRRCEQALQQFERGGVGEVQVVEQQRVDAAGGAAQQGLHRLQQRCRRARGQCRATRRCACRQLGQQRRQRRSLGGVGRAGVALDHGAQHADQRGVGHQRVPGPAADVQAPRVFGGQRLQQPRLAHAGLAHQHRHRPGGQALQQLRALGVAAHQAGRAQQRGRHRLALRRRAGHRRGAFDGGQQGQRLGRRRCADLVLERVLAAVEGQHRGGAVAAQVVQPHHASVGVFRQRIGRQQLQRQWQRGAGLAGVFEGLDACHEGLPLGGRAAGAVARQPSIELGLLGCAEVAQQRRGGREVVRHAGGQRQQGAAVDDVGAQLLAQAEQALPQRIARGLGVAGGPQQRAQPLARGRPFEGQPGQQQRVGRGQGRGVRRPVRHGCRLQRELHGGGGHRVRVLRICGAAIVVGRWRAERGARQRRRSTGDASMTFGAPRGAPPMVWAPASGATLR